METRREPEKDGELTVASAHAVRKAVEAGLITAVFSELYKKAVHGIIMI